MSVNAGDNTDRIEELAGTCAEAINKALCRIDGDQVIHPDLGIQERVLCY